MRWLILDRTRKAGRKYLLYVRLYVRRPQNARAPEPQTFRGCCENWVSERRPARSSARRVQDPSSRRHRCTCGTRHGRRRPGRPAGQWAAHPARRCRQRALPAARHAPAARTAALRSGHSAHSG